MNSTDLPIHIPSDDLHDPDFADCFAGVGLRNAMAQQDATMTRCDVIGDGDEGEADDEDWAAVAPMKRVA